MITLFKKTIWMGVLSGIVLLSACGDKTPETKTPPAPVAATEATKPTQTAKTYSAIDFTTDGLTIIEGNDYTKVANPQPVQVAGKIEVLEFFWYGCPHCNTIEPIVQGWKKTIPSDVNFTRAHAFWGKPMDQHQRIYYTLAALKKNDVMDDKVFDAMHNQGLGLAEPHLISDFMVKNGIDKETWEKTFNSFWVNTEVAKANEMFKAYALTGVPSFIVNGKYVVGGENVHTLQVINKLIEQERGKK